MGPELSPGCSWQADPFILQVHKEPFAVGQSLFEFEVNYL